MSVRTTLTERERRFVEAYTGEAAGNATKAAILAGYKRTAAEKAGWRLSNNVRIVSAIDQRASKDPLIATREERRRFWTSAFRDINVPWRDRLKASELLGKSEADFVDRLNLSGNIGLALFATPGGEFPAATNDRQE